MSLRALLVPIGIALAALALPEIACAQWMWKDEQGHTVISDQAPPPSIPLKNILKQPGRSAPAASAASADSSASKSLADQDLDFKKRQKEAAEASKKSQEAADRKAQDQEHCNSQRQNVTTLESGQRITRTDDQGNRYYLDDSTRQAELQRAQADMSKNCQ